MKKEFWRHKLEELFGLDLRAIAFMRIAFAFVIITDLIQRSFHISRDYTDNGILPRNLLLENRDNALSIHLMTGSIEGQIFLFITAGILALGLLVGYRTRLCSILSWIFYISLADRNFLLSSGTDTYLPAVLFWGIFLPWGKEYSIDSLKVSSPIEKNTFSSLATFGYTLQICLVYLMAGALKISPEWKDGTALYYILSLDQFAKPLGNYLLHYPNSLSSVSNDVPCFEKIVSLLLIFPFFTPFLRIIGVLLIVLFHLCIFATMDVGLLSFICIVAVVGLLPKKFWDILPLPRSNTTASPKGIETASSLRIVFLTATIIYIILYNFSTLPNNRIVIPKVFKTAGRFLHINQDWSMFARIIPHYSGWYVMEGSLKNGQEVNVLSGEDINFNKPRVIYKTYQGHRDTKLIENLLQLPGAQFRLNYARFLCREWNSSRQSNEKMVRIQAFFMKETTLLNNLKTPPKKNAFINYTCP